MLLSSCLFFLLLAPAASYASGGFGDPGLSGDWYEPFEHSLGSWDLKYYVDDDHPVYAKASDFQKADNPEDGSNLVLGKFRELNITERTKFLAHRRQALDAYVSKLVATEVREDGEALYFGGIRILEWPKYSRPPDSVLSKAKAAYVQKMLFFYDASLFKSAKVIVRRDQYGMQVGAFLSLNWVRMGFQKTLGKMIFKSDPDRGLSGLTMGFLLKTVYDKKTNKMSLDLSAQVYRADKLIFMPSVFELALYPVIGINSGHDQFEYLEPSLKFGVGAGDKVLGEGPTLAFYGGSQVEADTDMMISSIYVGQYGTHQITHSLSPPVPFFAFPPFITGLNTYRSRRAFTAGANLTFPAGKRLGNFMKKAFDRKRWLTAFQGFAGNNFFEISPSETYEKIKGGSKENAQDCVRALKELVSKE